ADDRAHHGVRAAGIEPVGQHHAAVGVAGAELPADNFGDTPVHDLHFTEATDHDVRRLQVTVDNAAVVGEAHAFADLDEDVEQAQQGVFAHGVAVALTQLQQDFGQAQAFHELHREVQVAGA